MINEGEAIEAAKADPRRFAPLYDRFFTDVFRFIRRRCTDDQTAADLSQQTFLKAMIGLQRYQDRGVPFRAWLCRIALNELRMYWRKKKEVSIEFAHEDAIALAADVSEEKDTDLQNLSQALSHLPEKSAQLIELRYIDGMSFKEMAAVMNISEDAAKMRTHRVLACLRTYLAPR